MFWSRYDDIVNQSGSKDVRVLEVSQQVGRSLQRYTISYTWQDSSSRPPSVVVDYGFCAGLEQVILPQGQRRLWLMGPMREWQSRPHFVQVWLVGVAVAMRVFRLTLFSLAEVWIFSSPDFSCLRRTQRHLLRSAAASSQLSVLMFRAFMSRLQTSL